MVKGRGLDQQPAQAFVRDHLTSGVFSKLAIIGIGMLPLRNGSTGERPRKKYDHAQKTWQKEINIMKNTSHVSRLITTSVCPEAYTDILPGPHCSPFFLGHEAASSVVF